MSIVIIIVYKLFKIRGEIDMANRHNYFKLEMLILSVLEDSDCYGYEISQQLKEKSHGLMQIKEGALYPILYKLQKEEYISSYEQSGKKTRVYYHLEEKGLKHLITLEEDYLKMVKEIKNICQFSEKKIARKNKKRT